MMCDLTPVEHVMWHGLPSCCTAQPCGSPLGTASDSNHDQVRRVAAQLRPWIAAETLREVAAILTDCADPRLCGTDTASGIAWSAATLLHHADQHEQDGLDAAPDTCAHQHDSP